MSASRTLLRRNRAPRFVLNDEGERVPRPIRTRVGTNRRRCTDISHQEGARVGWPDLTYAQLGLEADYHATKGYRVRRLPR